jgi:hypothetical protein
MAEKFASGIGLFNNIRSLDISKVGVQSVAHLKLLPRYLTHLKINFHNTSRHIGTLKMSDVSILPRTITHLTLIEGYWVNSDENAKDFCSLLPPNITYFCIQGLNESWNLKIAFSEMRTSLRHLQTLIIDTQHLWFDTFDPWLPCDTLHTLKIIAKEEGNKRVDPNLFSSWPTDIPNNIKRLELSLSNYGGGNGGPYEDDRLQKLPPHLTSLTLDGRCFRIIPSFFGSLPKSVTLLELSTCFTHQDEEEEEFEFDVCLKDTVIVRHCPKHIIELHMNYIFTGAFFPPNLTKLTTNDHGLLEVISRPQLPNQLRYCNLSYVKLDSNCIIPDTLTEIDFSRNEIDMALVSKIPNLLRLTGYAADPMDLRTFTSLKFLRLYSSLDHFRTPEEEEEEGKKNLIISTSLQELVLQSAWDEEASAYKLSQQFPNLTSLKIVDHHDYYGGKSHLFPPTIPNKKKIETGSTTPQQLPVLSKLQHLEVKGDLTITQSQLQHVTPNLTFLTIYSVSIDNFTEILQSLTPGITKLMISEIDIIKALCPSITTLGTPPPKIIFSGQEISFPVDCKALVSR